MHKIASVTLLAVALILVSFTNAPRFRVLALSENGGHHIAYSKAARIWLNQLAADSSFAIDYISNTDSIDAAFLSHYQLFIQLDYPPYGWKDKAAKAFEQYVAEGRGGWIGFHHATLLGEFDGYGLWSWFYNFMGKVRFKDYIAGFAAGKVKVEQPAHPVLKEVPAEFTIKTEEWYTYDRSPRPHVNVLASVDESSYTPASDKKMGDHPVIWTNPDYKARNVYIFMGHSPDLFENDAYKILFRNAIFWAAQKEEAPATLLVNQVVMEQHGPKTAVLQSPKPVVDNSFTVVNTVSGVVAFKGVLSPVLQVKDWEPGMYYYKADFSPLDKKGSYRVQVGSITSPVFETGSLAQQTVPAVLQYYRRQRATSPEETAIDQQLLLYGSDKRVNLYGGWCDASGDVSKYFSHLAYANFVSPQQIPLVTWSMIQAADKRPALLQQWKVMDSLRAEALWGADYLVRAQSDSGYFYQVVFSYFNKDPHARRVVGLEANSVTTADYQCAYREGAGMAIAALARVSQWPQHGDYTNTQYLAAAERGFAHLQVNNTRYDDDGKENIIDDYCALMAATELWIATGKTPYRDAARLRAGHLAERMTNAGYFIADDGSRPFWHAADAGLPVVALVRYLDKETALPQRTLALSVIKKAIDYNLRVTAEVPNPFGYARQSFRYRGRVMNGFFIPHENETGWWWQGENARLASLATAVLTGGRLVYPAKNSYGTEDRIARYYTSQLSWILGCNPYDVCFMYGFGKTNVPYMQSMFGHGSQRGGISNGITGKEGRGDGSGIDFKMEAEGNEWRWTEQWIPHAAWFLQAVMAL